MFNSVVEKNEFEIEINKSIFICNIKYVTSVEQAKHFIDEIKDKYKDATHNCSAYIINEKSKYDDDGEPNLTAGYPMYQVLVKKKMNYVCCVSTRYFGGIKLGGGGLIRAYSKSVSSCLEHSNIIRLIKGFVIEIKCEFKFNDKVTYLIRNIEHLNYDVKFEFKVCHKLNVCDEVYMNLKSQLSAISHLIEVEVIEEILYPKELNE